MQMPLSKLQSMITTIDSKHGPPLHLHDIFLGNNTLTTTTTPPISTPVNPITLAAEFKRASPSKGDIALHVDVAVQVAAYVQAGASVVSILTEPKWFKGSLQDMLLAREAVHQVATRKMEKSTEKSSDNSSSSSSKEKTSHRAAVLRKDFVVDIYQLYEARGKFFSIMYSFLLVNFSLCELLSSYN